MATIEAVVRPFVEARSVTWEAMAAGDTINPHELKGVEGVAGNIQASGSFGGGTLTLLASNDKVTWFALSDIHGNSISLTSNGMAEFTTAALFIKPKLTGGSGADVDVVAGLRG